VMRTEERSYTTMRSIYFYTSLSKLFFLRQLLKISLSMCSVT
jgi:hypothetical protein